MTCWTYQLSQTIGLTAGYTHSLFLSFHSCWFFWQPDTCLYSYIKLHRVSKPEIVLALSSCAPGGPGRWISSWQQRTPTQTRRRRRSWPKGKCPLPWCRRPEAWTHSLQWWWWTWSALWWCLDTIERQHSSSAAANCRLKMCSNLSFTLTVHTQYNGLPGSGS